MFPHITSSHSPNRVAVRFAAGRSGSALIIALVFIGLLAGVLVAFVVTSGFERKTVSLHTGKVHADLYSSMATRLAVARLSEAASAAQPATPNALLRPRWSALPGKVAVTTPGASASQNPTTRVWNLSSGIAAAEIDNLSVNLNPRALLSSEGILDGAPGTVVPLRWVYVRKDGTQIHDPASVPAYVENDTNPIVGRFAFWADDENSRINLNAVTASANPSAEADNHPSKLNLVALDPLTDASFGPLRTSRATRPFNTVEEARASSGSDVTKAGLNRNKSALTTYNHSANLNRFGQPRIALTTQRSLLTPEQTARANAGELVFLDILADDKQNTDPGVLDNISNEKVARVIDALYPYFTRTAREWGLETTEATNLWSKTFLQKYERKERLAQIILNIIEYVRSVESAETIILPIRGAFPRFSPPADVFVGGGGAGADSSYGERGIIGNSRRPHIVELGLWVDKDPVTATPPTGAPYHYFNATLKTRIYLPASVGDSIDLASGAYDYFWSIYPVVTGAFQYVSSNVTLTADNIEETGEAGRTIEPGQYRTLVTQVQIRGVGSAIPARPAQVYLRTGFRRSISAGGLMAYDLAPVKAGGSSPPHGITYNVSPAGGSAAEMTSLSINDPSVGQSVGDWRDGNANAFGTNNPPPASTLSSAPTGDNLIPQQDTDENDQITDVSIAPPPPRGKGANGLGRIGSVGELGRVHTGGAGTGVRGVPWRTLRLQPRRGNVQTMLPDWLLTDLFMAPAPASQMTLPGGDASVAGKVNLNSLQHGFDAAHFPRAQPLKALLMFAKPGIGEAELETLVENVRERTPAAGGNLRKGFLFGTEAQREEAIYSMPGEIVEIAGISDGGERSEIVAARMLEHLTVESNVFSIYAIGQRVTQRANGSFIIRAESRSVTTVERLPTGRIEVVATRELGL